MQKARVLVAGGAGYIGSHMVKNLLEAGCQVTTLDDLATGHRALVPGGELVVGGIGDAELLDELFERRSFDAVMHFAARSLVGESVQKPLAYWRNNVASTVTLIEAMQRHGVSRFIFSSTAAVYGEPREVPISESAPCAPTNPYGNTKLAIERLLADLEQAGAMRSVALRYFNAAGADPEGAMGERHEPETHLIPIVLQCAAGTRESVAIYGTDYPTPDGSCLRDYVHVEDLCAAHRLALERLMDGGAGGVFNLGNSRGYSVIEVIERARSVTGRPIRAHAAPRRPGDPAVLVADSSRARRELGWKPRYEDLGEIIGTAWNWHSNEAMRFA